MIENVEFDIDGATLTVPKKQLLNRWLANLLTPQNVTTDLLPIRTKPPRINTEWMEQGGIYTGVIGGENGAPDYHLIFAPLENEIVGVNHAQALDQSKKPINGFDDWYLPDRRETRLIAINAPDTFDKDGWYWTFTQYATTSDYAWLQLFSNGIQDVRHESYEGRARAVRRVSII
ncbi:DUF1566 domain-containing protein [Undibacterium sp. Ji22W]|uniref:Lcl domain-containing protein n=1 Tax=Undibacterium sp. Ji22W TaxID=3413038 RepID=UPI003BF0A719